MKPRQYRILDSLSEDELASVAPQSMDLFNPMANPSASKPAGSSHIGDASKRTRSSEHRSKKKVAFAVQSLSPTRKEVKNMLLQKNKHWLSQVLQAWSLFA